jgi:acyl-CoA synthetase (AMP-forming)/AMP-acid ligase II
MPNKTYLIFEDKSVTYQEFDRATDCLAAGFQQIGIKQKENVAVLLPNGLEIIHTYMALWKLGVVAVPISNILLPNEWEYYFTSSQAKVLVTNSAFLEKILTIKDRLGYLEQIILVGEAGEFPSLTWKIHELEALLGCTKQFEAPVLRPHDVILICYTSGTEGKPKGAMITNKSITWDAKAYIGTLGWKENDKAWAALPLFHFFAISWGIVGMCTAGGTYIIHERYEPVKILQSIEKHKATVTFGPTPIYSGLLYCPELPEYDISSFRMGACGGQTLPIGFLREWDGNPYLKKCLLLEIYGQTEAAPAVTIPRPGEERRLGSAGPALEGIEMKIVDDSMEEVPIGEVGEIVYRGPNMLKGYWQMPEATEATLKLGWLRSGDLGRMDSDEFLYVVDRKKDMIRYRGFPVFPKEAEDVLSTHPAVEQVAIVGSPHPIDGDIPKGYIVLKKGSTASADELISYSKEKLASYKTPRIIEFVDSLPISPTGKILKRVLREQELNKLAEEDRLKGLKK